MTFIVEICKNISWDIDEIILDVFWWRLITGVLVVGKCKLGNVLIRGRVLRGIRHVNFCNVLLFANLITSGIVV